LTTRPATFLAELRREIEAHPAVNHLFLNRLATSPFSREDYRVFAENHFPLVRVFTSYLETLLLRAPTSESKLWIAKVLVDEYGEGSQGQDHGTLYARFLSASGGDPTTTDEAELPKPALEFIRDHRRLPREAPYLEGLGAVGPGHEWAIPKMFEAVIPGLRRAGFTDDAIDYFTLHVDQDGDHGKWLEHALAEVAVTDEDQTSVRRGALASLEARGRFWSGVQRAVIRYRQPRAARPDGPTPRGVLHEVLLTAWDGSSVGRALQHKARGIVKARRPTLAALLQSARTRF
jgi:pyrroloquinoline-quinone synthase